MLRRRRWIKLPWATIIRARRRNISHKKVCKHPRHVSIRGVAAHQTDQICFTDYSAGFGGRYGVQTDRMDKVSVTDIYPFIPDSSGGRLIHASGNKNSAKTPKYNHSESSQHHSEILDD